jgi:hypothetical protein
VEVSAVTDPEDTVSVSAEEFAEHEADVADDLTGELPLEAEQADAVEQLLEVPDEGEDEYR